MKIAHAELAAAVSIARLQTLRVQAAEVADELAARQADAGNITTLQRAAHAAALDEARMELLERELNVSAAREQLNRLMGLWGEDTGWTPATGAAELPEDGDLSVLEQHGVRERLDVSAARFDVDAVEYALKLRRRGLIPNVDVGVEGRNEVGDDIGHEWVVGPSLHVELPLFDPGHADLARLRAQLRQAQHLYQDAAIVARSQIREGRAAIVAARRRAEYMLGSVLPRHELIYEQTLAEYNGMQVGAYELFSVRSGQVHAQQEYAEALRDYWIARAQLEYWVGGRLPSAARHGGAQPSTAE